jgi:hypothetical protein
MVRVADVREHGGNPKDPLHVTSVRNLLANAKALLSRFTTFVFGSSSTCTNPNDLDRLFMYDSRDVSPRDAFALLRTLIAEIEQHVGLRVHATVLLTHEARNSGFIDQVEAVAVAWTGTNGIGQAATLPWPDEEDQETITVRHVRQATHDPLSGGIIR